MTGPSFADAIAHAVDQLQAENVAASGNSATLQPGAGVWVTGRTATPSTLGGSWEVDLDLLLYAQGVDDTAAYAALDELVEQVAGLFGLADDGRVEVTSLQLAGSTTPIPAYRYPISVYTQE